MDLSHCDGCAVARIVCLPNINDHAVFLTSNKYNQLTLYAGRAKNSKLIDKHAYVGGMPSSAILVSSPVLWPYP
jgi:hypothetical protein